MVKHGAVLRDSVFPTCTGYLQLSDSSVHPRHLDKSAVLASLATFDGSHEFIVDVFRAGAGFKLL